MAVAHLDCRFVVSITAETHAQPVCSGLRGGGRLLLDLDMSLEMARLPTVLGRARLNKRRHGES
jgi:hypothetical protein